MISNLLRPEKWRISLKIPLMVVFLMFAVSVVVTQQVLSRLSTLQDENLRELSSTYLDGLSSAVLPHVLRRDIWEVFDILDRSKPLYQNVKVVHTIVTDGQDRVIAASDPRRFATGTRVPADILARAQPETALKIKPGNAQLHVSRPISYQNRTVGHLIVAVNVARQLAERRQVKWALIATNTGLALLFSVLGYWLTRRMTRPMEVLAGHLDESRDGRSREIDSALIAGSGREVARLFSSYNAMVRAASERDQLAARLHEEEKLAGIGRLASAMAHEINNPLGGLLNTVDTLRAHGARADVRQKSLGLLERGLKNIGGVVRATLTAYRGRLERRALCEKDFSDLRYLLQPDLQRRRQTLGWEVGWHGRLPVEGGPMRQVCLNLLLNASAAAGAGGRLAFRSFAGDAALVAIVENDGSMFSPATLAMLNSGGGRAALENGAGLGLWLVCQYVDDMGGRLAASVAGGRARIEITIPFGGQDMLDAA